MRQTMIFQLLWIKPTKEQRAEADKELSGGSSKKKCYVFDFDLERVKAIQCFTGVAASHVCGTPVKPNEAAFAKK